MSDPIEALISAPRISLSRQGINLYHLLSRSLASAWFLLLAVLIATALLKGSHSGSMANPGGPGWASLLSRWCLVAFYLSLWFLILVRPNPTARAKGPLPVAMAFLGTYLPWVLPFIPASGPVSATVQVISAVLLTTGGLLILFTVYHLGISFSIVPQARQLVRSGPYRVIRHPLYVAEEISLCGAVLHFWSPWSVLLLLVHCVLQVRRMSYEEALLVSVFPDYQAYATATARVVPWLW